MGECHEARGAGPHPSLLPGWQFLGPMPRPVDLHRIPLDPGDEALLPACLLGSGSAPRNISLLDQDGSQAPGHVTQATSLPPDGGGGIPVQGWQWPDVSGGGRGERAQPGPAGAVSLTVWGVLEALLLWAREAGQGLRTHRCRKEAGPPTDSGAGGSQAQPPRGPQRMSGGTGQADDGHGVGTPGPLAGARATAAAVTGLLLGR